MGKKGNTSAKKAVNKRRRNEHKERKSAPRNQPQRAVEVGAVYTPHSKTGVWAPFTESKFNTNVPKTCPYTKQDFRDERKRAKILKRHHFTKQDKSKKSKGYPNMIPPPPLAKMYECKFNGQSIGRSKWNSKYGLLWQKTNSIHTRSTGKQHQWFCAWWLAYHHGLFTNWDPGDDK